MNIDTSGFDRALQSKNGTGEAPPSSTGGFGRGDKRIEPVEKPQSPTLDVPAPTPSVEIPEVPATSTMNIPMFTRPGDQLDTQNTPVEPSPKAKKKMAWNWRLFRSKPAASELPISSAKKENPTRVWVAVVIIFVIGAVLGPWLSQNPAPPAPQPAGPNPAAKAIADTLNGESFGSLAKTEPGVDHVVQQTEVAPPTPTVEPKPIAPEGEARYLDMLTRMKESTNVDAPKVVPKIDPSARTSISPQEYAYSQPVNPYPASPIPLEIEKGTSLTESEQPKLEIDRGLTPAGRYVVLQLAYNEQGILSALMMPIGGRRAIDAAWVFVGDATSDGLVVEAISRSAVVLRTPNGRTIALSP